MVLERTRELTEVTQGPWDRRSTGGGQMFDERIHRAVSPDGTGVAARVRGDGPPLVLLPAAPGDSETSWGAIVPFVSQRFTCYLLNTRGRGLSADHADHSSRRLVEDVVAFVESLGQPAGLVGWGSPLWAHVAADHPAVVPAVAAYEPGADEVASDEIRARFVEVFGHAGKLADEGRLVDAARLFIDKGDVVYTEEDLASGEPWHFWRASAPYVPIFLEEQGAVSSTGPGPTDPAVLSKIAAPVLLMVGTRTKPWFVDSARHIARHVGDARIREIAGAGHFAPRTAPETVADEIVRFFAKTTTTPLLARHEA
jgi:pimeloyl-ACP methyl ester carboxylesterase